MAGTLVKLTFSHKPNCRLTFDIFVYNKNITNVNSMIIAYFSLCHFWFLIGWFWELVMTWLANGIAKKPKHVA